MFEKPTTGGVPRRAFLLMPLPFVGLIALYSRANRPRGVRLSEPDARLSGEVMLNKVVRTDEEWKRLLSEPEFLVTRRKGTEPAFSGQYWNTHEPGLYNCVCCGTTLFRSQEKFDSGTGWPSFWAPVSEQIIALRSDHSLILKRVEVLCARCDAHLGHVFEDGPEPTGLRYCLNSAALRFSALPADSE